MSKWRIYQVFPNSFVAPGTPQPTFDYGPDVWHGGNLKTICNQLDYISSLGFNTILLGPVFKTAAPHGYHIISFEDIDEHFGSWQDFEDLVARAHSMGMNVIYDFVANHCHYDNAIFQKALSGEKKYRDWFFFKDNNEYVSFLGYPDLPKFNLDHPQAAKYMIEKMSRIARLGVDAFRLDHAIGLPFSFLKQARKAMRQVNPDIFILGEVWANGINPALMSQVYFKSYEKMLDYKANGFDQEAVQCDYIGVLDGILDFKFRSIILDEIHQGNRIKGNKFLRRKLIDHFKLYPTDFNLVLFVDSHDTNRFLFESSDDVSLLAEVIELMQDVCRPFSIFYGTEALMSNKQGKSIDDGSPYADLRVREPMAWEHDKYNILNVDNKNLKPMIMIEKSSEDRKRTHSPNEEDATVWVPTDPHWKLSNIVASDGLKMKLSEMLTFMQNVESIKSMGLTRFRPNGGVSWVFNLYGESGTGKSSIAESLAAACSMKIIKVTYSDLQGSKWGSTERNLTSLFECAKQHNALIILDEADYLFSSRQNDGGSNSEILNQIKAHTLTLLDNYEVFIVATTNRSCCYDAAMYRRVAWQVHVPLPEKKEILRLVNFHFGSDDEGCNEGGVIPKASDFSFEQASDLMQGLAGGDIAVIAQHCMVKAFMSANHELTLSMLKEAIDDYKSEKALMSREVKGAEKAEVERIINNN